MCNRFLFVAAFITGVLSSSFEAAAVENTPDFGMSKTFFLENLGAKASAPFDIFKILQANNEKCAIPFFSWKPRTSISDC